MMTTNKNQRTTHIDDVVKCQPRPFFAHCAICDFFYNYLCMHFIFADENDEITHTYTPVLFGSAMFFFVLFIFRMYDLSFCFFSTVLIYLSFSLICYICTICASFGAQYNFIFFFVCSLHSFPLCHTTQLYTYFTSSYCSFVQNYVSRQNKKKIKMKTSYPCRKKPDGII